MPTMPNCVGLEYEAALLAMVNAGVRVLPLGYFQGDPVSLLFVSSSEDSGIVLQQYPIGGIGNVSANSTVVLMCSQFPVGVAYPYMTDISKFASLLASSIPSKMVPGYAIPGVI